jgi:hypothetical protein
VFYGGENVTDRHGTEDQLRQEVRELTELLRTDVSFADLRGVLATRGLDPSHVLLAGLIEGEEEHQYGVLIAVGFELIRFEIGRKADPILWEIVDDPDVLVRSFSAVVIGIKMKRAGQIS